jgi:hypothetical protein
MTSGIPSGSLYRASSWRYFGPLSGPQNTRIEVYGSNSSRKPYERYRLFSVSFGKAVMRIRDGKKSRTGMNLLDHISESLETIFWVKHFLNSLMLIRIRDPESFRPGIRNGKIGINIPDPQHCG